MYDTDATFSTLTYQSSKSFTHTDTRYSAMEQVGNKVYALITNSTSAKAYNLDRTADTSFDFTRNSENNNANFYVC